MLLPGSNFFGFMPSKDGFPTLLRLVGLRERPGALEEQLSLFNDWDEPES